MDMLLLLVSIITIFISTAFKSIIFYNKNVSFFSLLMLSIVEIVTMLFGGLLLFAMPIIYFGLMIPFYILVIGGLSNIFSSFIVNTLTFLVLYQARLGSALHKKLRFTFVKQSLTNRHYQVELGNERKIQLHCTLLNVSDAPA